MSELRIHTDGGARGNPGPAAAGIVFSMGDWTHGFGKCIGDTTNNVAEYSAVIEALLAIPEIIAQQGNISSLHFYLDSQLVVRQILGEYRVKEAGLQKLHAHVLELLRGLSLSYSFSHIPRSENAEADKLVNKALDEQRSNS